MSKQIYLGSTPLIDLTGYATESYVDTAVSNVDVTDQLSNYALKTSLDASIEAVDASIKSSDASIAAIKTTLASITGEGAETDTIINTWNEMKQFVSDYTTDNDLSTLISSVKSQAVDDASADAAAKYQPIGSYLVADDISTFVTAADVASQINTSLGNVYTKAQVDASFYTKEQVYAKPEINNQISIINEAISMINTNSVTLNDISTFVDAAAVATAINSSIAALDLANTYQAKGDYLVADDISTFITGNDISTFVSATDIAATYQTKNDSSNHVAGSGVSNIVKCTSTEFAGILEKDANTLYIVTD